MRDYNSIPFKLPRRTTTSREYEVGTSKALSTLSQNSGSTQESTPEKEAPVVQEQKHAQPQKFITSHPLAERSPMLEQHQQQQRRNNPNSNPEASISKLRNALEESTSFPVEESTNSSTLNNNKSAAMVTPKSDAVILELRSSVRQLRRQLDKLQEEKAQLEQEHGATMQELHMMKNQHNNPQDARMGELQVQLDRAHAQILTADMVRKELEDTLEAEQYTWELRVQDQERAIQLLREECAVLQEDLQQCRQQWKEAEESYTKEVGELQEKLDRAQQEAVHWKSMQHDSHDVEQLKTRLLELEQERGELQGCLDEALKELEAVDAELQSDVLRKDNERLQRELEQRGSPRAGDDPVVLESLQHLHRWLLEREGEESSHLSSPRDARGLLSAIQSHLERMPTVDTDAVKMRDQIEELSSQISVYRGDLKAREESSAELRASLKEAVALLKPLQDAVAKADKEKAKLLKEVDELKGNKVESTSSALVKKMKGELAIKEQEIDRLKFEIQQLEIELSRAKVTAASSLITAQRSVLSDSGTPDSLTRTREELKAKRATEKTLKQLLRDAQTRFQTLHSQNQEIEAMNNELQGRLKDAEEKLDTKPSNEESDTFESVQRHLTGRDVHISDLEMQLEALKIELAKKDADLRNKAQEVENLKSAAVAQNNEKARFLDSQARLRELEAKLAVSKDELHSKKDTERALKKSLREALSLLKPLQTHLEEAENEKKELLEDMRKLRKKGEQEGTQTTARAFSKDSPAVRELEATVKLLELENAQLHDALEDMSQSINASHMSVATSGSTNKQDSRLREEIVQLKSRNEVTQKQLEMARRDNSTLAETLSQREKNEMGVSEEMKALREKLRKTEAELENAKFIATSALVKVEELTMANVEQLSLNSSTFDHEAMFHEKARDLDREMKAVREQSQLPQVQYRLT